MRLVRRQVKLNGAANRPSWEAEPINPLNFSDAILEGFTSMYRLLLDHRERSSVPSRGLWNSSLMTK